MVSKERKTTEDFILEMSKLHNNKYDYSKVNYINRNTKVIITCHIHGDFEQTPNGHQKGYGCYECGRNKCKKTTEDFILEAKSIHGDKYDYSKTKYTHAFNDVIITCPMHGDFKQRPNNHLNSCGCKKCSLDDISKQFSDNKESFIEKAVKVHGDKYGYSLVNYIDSTTNVKIICQKHGEFEQLPSNHLQGTRCPLCTISKGEEKILNWLQENGIEFNPQHRFNNCRDIRPLPFDFYLPDYNTCIEYQGRQHFESVDAWGGNDAFKDRQRKDQIKENYCKLKGIKLISIHHNEDIQIKLKTVLI